MEAILRLPSRCGLLGHWRATMFAHTHCITRGMPESFLEALAMHPPPQPIDLALAAQQHEDYTKLVKELVAGIAVDVPADDTTPDCCFIEDTAVVLGTGALNQPTAVAIITHPGAVSRQPEVGPVREALECLGFSTQPTASKPHQLHQLAAPATLDGGDVLWAGSGGLWIGISQRTNNEAVQQVASILHGVCSVHGLLMPPGPALHLKSLVTALAEDAILVADNDQGRALVALAQSTPGAVRGHQFIYVPDMLAANVLRIRQHVVMQAGFPQSESIIRAECEKRGLTLHCLSMEEFAKADGALTCCSLLFSL